MAGVAVPEYLVDPPSGDAVSGRRAEILDLLRRADAPLTVLEVAGQIGLHRNTARFHLDALVGDGLVQRSAEDREDPGRPRILYSAGPDAGVGVRSFQLLAEMLAGVVAGQPDPAATAAAMGSEWGRHLTEKVPPSQRLDEAEVRRRLHGLLGRIGFDPEIVQEGDGAEVRLRHCPFREVAERHQEVVCALHLGLIRGALAEMRSGSTAEDLLPFAGPSLCISHLRPLQP